MWWLPIALLGSLAAAFTFVFMKKLSATVNEYTIIGITYMAAALILSLFIFPSFYLITPEVILITLFNGLVGGVADILYVRSLKLSEISSVIPLLCLTPIFMLATASVLVGEFPSDMGLLGIGLVVFGALMLSGFSLKNLLKYEGAKLMLIVAFLFAFNGVFDKMSTVRTNGFVAAFLGLLSIGAVVLAYSFYARKLEIGKLLKDKKNFLLFLVSILITSVCITWAIGETLTAYAITVKRFSVLFGIILGGYFFHENNIGWKLASALVMIGGLAMIALS